MHRLLRQPRWLRAIGLTLLFSVGCLLLADWQLHRREAKLAAIALIRGNYHRSPVPVADLLPTAGAALPRGREWTPVRAQGTYVAAETLLVRNRSDDEGDGGYLVLVPLRLDGGGVFLVDRGWIPRGATAETSAPVPAPPAGRVDVVARLHPPEPPDGRSAPAGQVQVIDLRGDVARGIAAGGDPGRQDAAALLRGAYGQLASEDPAVPAPRAAAAPEPDEGPHLAYAVQWCVFALGGWAFLLVQMRRTAFEQDVAAGRRERRAQLVVADPRRRPRDEDVEDGLLDAAEHAHHAVLQAAARARGRTALERPPTPLGSRGP